MNYYAIALFAFVIGFAIGVVITRRSIQKYGLHQTRYEKNLAEYLGSIGPHISEADRKEIKSRPLTRHERFEILAGDGSDRDD